MTHTEAYRPHTSTAGERGRSSDRATRQRDRRSRTSRISEAVVASYIHDITLPVRRSGAVRPAPVRLRPGARPRRVTAPVPAAA